MKAAKTQYGIAVDNGHFQAQLIEYAKSGHATVTPLSRWLNSMAEAEAVIRPYGWLPYRERDRQKPADAS